MFLKNIFPNCTCGSSGLQFKELHLGYCEPGIFSLQIPGCSDVDANMNEYEFSDLFFSKTLHNFKNVNHILKYTVVYNIS